MGSSFSTIKFIGWGWDGERLILQESQSGEGTLGSLHRDSHICTCNVSSVDGPEVLRSVFWSLFLTCQALTSALRPISGWFEYMA